MRPSFVRDISQSSTLPLELSSRHATIDPHSAPMRRSAMNRFVFCLLIACWLSLIAVSSPTWAVDNGKLKVFILVGQSNMEGFGKVEHGGNPNTATRDPNVLAGMGSLRAMVNNNPGAYNYLLDTSKTVTYSEPGNSSIKKTFPAWATRNDVWVSYWDSPDLAPPKATVQRRNGALTVGFGVDNNLPEGFIGPEFGFGHIVGNAVGDKVLLIKTAWGGKSLAVDFRPPRSSGNTGAYYTEMINRVGLVLSNIKAYYPAYNGAGYEIAGFGWHQGWNDRINDQYAAEYEVNLANLIRDVRADLGAPKMHFVLAVEQQKDSYKDNNAQIMLSAQNRITSASVYPEFAGNIAAVDTNPFNHGPNSPSKGFIHHWNYNGQSYFQIGESMGKAMVALLKKSNGSAVAFKAKINGKFVTAENAGLKHLIANRGVANRWETFDLIHNSDGTISLKAHVNGKYVTADNAASPKLIANRDRIALWEKFDLMKNADGTVSLKAKGNGKYVTADHAGNSPLIANRSGIGTWEKFEKITR